MTKITVLAILLVVAFCWAPTHAQIPNLSLEGAAESTDLKSAKQPNTDQKKQEHTMVIMKTSMGDITIELFDEKAPITVKNFLEYVDAKHYNGTIFHRVIDSFMIQGGGFTGDFVQKATRSQIKNEADNGLKNSRGTLAMARTSIVDSATSQFFINVVDNVFLDHRGTRPNEYGYCVFGRVTEGMDVVEKMKSVKTKQHGPHANVPVEPIEIIDVVRAE